MTEALLFVTAESADHKTINRFLVSFKDYSEADDLDVDTAHLVTSKNVYEIVPDPESDKAPDLGYTKPDLREGFNNGWRGSRIKDVESWVLDAEKPDNSWFGTIVILDDQGVRDETVVVASRGFDDETDEMSGVFYKTRVPWLEAWSMWTNLVGIVLSLVWLCLLIWLHWISNMDFMDFVNDFDEREEEQEWFDYAADLFSSEMSQQGREAVEQAMKALEDEGLA